MITTEIMGGLGNQLFQIFNLISYALTNKIPFYFENKTNIREDRPFYWSNFFSALKPFLRDSHSKIPFYKERGHNFNELVSFNEIGAPFKFVGYFQSYKYFQDNVKDIFKYIKLNEQKDIVINKYNNIYKLNQSISLHFRLGDYKNLQGFHPVLNISYYVSAISNIINRTEINNWNILYFYEHEDENVIKANINMLQHRFKQIKFIPIDTEIVDYEQMLIMSLCQHNIIANSSFSWWGAYINTNPDKIICYPDIKHWFGPRLRQNDLDDMFPKEWVQIQIN